MIHRNGSLHWVSPKGQTYYEGEGMERRAVGFSGTMADITAEKAARDALRESERKYRSVFNSIDQGYCVIEVLFDTAGQPTDYLFLEVNPAFGQQTGLQDAVGKRMRELAPSHESKWFEIYGRVAVTGQSVRLESEAAALGRWFDVFANRVGEPGEHRVAVTFTDITERRANARALQAKEAASGSWPTWGKPPARRPIRTPCWDWLWTLCARTCRRIVAPTRRCRTIRTPSSSATTAPIRLEAIAVWSGAASYQILARGCGRCCERAKPW